MFMSIRTRILLTLLPLFLLLAALGAAGAVLLYRLGSRIDAIVHENYDSVRYMERLNEALERIDSSFQFALANRDAKARDQFAENWVIFDEFLAAEQQNITLPHEGEEVDRLTKLTDRYRKLGKAFYAQRAGSPARHKEYFDSGGLYDTFKLLKASSGSIRQMNQENIEHASHEARRAARNSLIGFGGGLGLAVLLACVLAWQTVNAALRPIRAVTKSAVAIGAGNLDQVVPVMSRDELGQLAEAFNAMARQLRYYRQTGYARLLRAQRTSQATIDSFPDPVVVVDDQSRVELANPAAQRLLGVTGRGEDQPPSVPWTPPESIRMPLQDAVTKQYAYVPQGFDHVVQVRQDGTDRFFLPRILPISDPYGNTLGAAVLLEDVTRFRLLDQVKGDLVATASHELKTPLTSLRLALHLLLEEVEGVGSLTPKQAELLVDARDNAERLLAVVNRLFDLARLEQAGELIDRRAEAPLELLQAAADSAAPRAADKEIMLTIDAEPGLPQVAADATRLGHALGNLLDNAITYTERGGHITLAARMDGEQVELSVSDTGLGIPPEHLPHVFTKFFRVPGQHHPGGTGLGLAITREIVQAHDGTIACESREGAGTVFRIRLPVWKGESANGSAAAIATTSQTTQ